jgi:hypothetical protein
VLGSFLAAQGRGFRVAHPNMRHAHPQSKCWPGSSAEKTSCPFTCALNSNRIDTLYGHYSRCFWPAGFPANPQTHEFAHAVNSRE